jgi:replicative DNA helicase
MNNQPEQAVLGALILDGTKIDNDKIIALTSNDFTSTTHKLIFQSMLDLNNSDSVIDIITVVSKLKNTKVDIGYLTELSENCPTSANISYYAKIVKENSGKRVYDNLEQYIRDNKKVKTNLELAEHIQRELDKLTADSNPDSTEHIGGILKTTYEKLEAIEDNPNHIIGIPTGFEAFDKLTTGLQGSQLIIIAGRPAMGKSAWVGNVVEFTAKKGLKTLGFNLEMSKDELGLRYIASTSEVPMYTMKTGHNTKENWESISEAVGEHYDLPLWINDTPALSVAQIRAKCRQHKRQYGLDLVAIDYLQLIKGNGHSREQEVSDISRSLKSLAKELDIPIICLAQLSRKCEERNDKRPMLSDLRESGAIEQDADIVAFIYREEIYNKCECPMDLTCTCDRRDKAELIIAKQRQGSTGTVDLKFRKDISKFIGV